MPQGKRIRADALAVKLGLAKNTDQALRLIMAGRIAEKVSAGKALPIKVKNSGQLYKDGTQLILLPQKTFVSRGAYKLLTILNNLNLDISGLVCLDAGASTGGFTDCLLQNGASKVYAVDAGVNLLHEKLRSNPRVSNLEGINLQYPHENLLPEKVDLITGDISFISLTKILPSCIPWLKSNGKAIVLIKPQFELSPQEMRKGVVYKEESRQKAVKKVIDFCQHQLGMFLQVVLPAQIKGAKGNQEYVALFNKLLP